MRERPRSSFLRSQKKESRRGRRIRDAVRLDDVLTAAVNECIEWHQMQTTVRYHNEILFLPRLRYGLEKCFVQPPTLNIGGLFRLHGFQIRCSQHVDPLPGWQLDDPRVGTRNDEAIRLRICDYVLEDHHQRTETLLHPSNADGLAGPCL